MGGLEKTIKGSVSYTPENHEYMVRICEEKVERIKRNIPDLKVHGRKPVTPQDRMCSSYGHIITAVSELQQEGYSISAAVFNYIRPCRKTLQKWLRI